MERQEPGQAERISKEILGESCKGYGGLTMGEYTGKNPRYMSWNDYGIGKKRHAELQEVLRSGRYDELVHNAAYRADEKIAEYLLKSVKESKSYDKLEFDSKLGRICVGKSDFYSIRRLFFHCLDVALKQV